MFNDGELVWFCVIDNFGPQQICRSFYGRIIGTTYFCEYDDTKTIYEIQAECTVCGKHLETVTFNVEEKLCFHTLIEADSFRDEFNEQHKLEPIIETTLTQSEKFLILQALKSFNCYTSDDIKQEIQQLIQKFDNMQVKL